MGLIYQILESGMVYDKSSSLPPEPEIQATLVSEKCQRTDRRNARISEPRGGRLAGLSFPKITSDRFIAFLSSN